MGYHPQGELEWQQEQDALERQQTTWERRSEYMAGVYLRQASAPRRRGWFRRCVARLVQLWRQHQTPYFCFKHNRTKDQLVTPGGRFIQWYCYQCHCPELAGRNTRQDACVAQYDKELRSTR